MNFRIALVAALVPVLLAAVSCAKGDQVGDGISGRLEFEIIPTFRPPIRFSLSANPRESRAKLTAEIYAGQGGYDWGEVERLIEKEISKETFRELTRMAQGLDFERILTSDQPSGLDGTNWVLRLQNGGSELILNIWSPPGSDEAGDRGLSDFVKLGERLLELAEIQDPQGKRR